jgi:lysophospholipase L1-like esterase
MNTRPTRKAISIGVWLGALLVCVAVHQHARKTGAIWLLTHYSDREHYQCATAQAQVVFFGDSIIERWPTASMLPNRAILNRGIGGQVSGQMLARFRKDVLDWHPHTVVIEAGTNDLFFSADASELQDNLKSMADLAEANEVRPIFASVLPVLKESGTRTNQNIRRHNEWLRDFCARRGFMYLDLYASVVAGDHLKPEWTDDGLHPNEAGYMAISAAAKKAGL